MYRQWNGLFITAKGIENTKPKSSINALSQERIDLCKQWILENCVQRRTVWRDDYSYNIKREAEQALGCHISNGDLIWATIDLGLKVKRYSKSSVHAMLAFVPPSKAWQTIHSIGFSRWLFQHVKVDTPIGDLAQDAKNDCRWPRRAKKLTDFQAVLKFRGASSRAMEVLEEAWNAYMNKKNDADTLKINGKLYTTWRGFAITHCGVHDRRDENIPLPPNKEEIELSKKWILEHCDITKNQYKHGYSYAIKHEAEKDIGSYISNGALIVAAIELNIKIKQDSDGPSVFLGILSPAQKWRGIARKGFTAWLYKQEINTECHPWIKHDLLEDVKVDPDWPRRCKTLGEIHNMLGWRDSELATWAWMEYYQLLFNDGVGLAREPSTLKYKIEHVPESLSGVYLIRAKTTNFFKIGKADDLQKRVNQMQGHCPHELVPYAWIPYPFAHQLEKATHNEFYAMKHQREWFEFENLDPVYNWFSRLESALRGSLGWTEAKQMGVGLWNYGHWKAHNIIDWDYSDDGHENCLDYKAMLEND